MDKSKLLISIAFVLTNKRFFKQSSSNLLFFRIGVYTFASMNQTMTQPEKNLLSQYQETLEGLQEMLAKAKINGPNKKYRGFTIAQLQDSVNDYKKIVDNFEDICKKVSYANTNLKGKEFELNRFTYKILFVTPLRIVCTFSNKAGSIKDKNTELDIQYLEMIQSQIEERGSKS